MKKIILITICFAIAILGGCRNVFTGIANSPAGGGETLPDGYGVLRVSFARGMARTAMPDKALDDFELEFFFKDSSNQDVEARQSDDYTFILQEGEYTLVVKAWNKTTPAKTELVAEGSKDGITITAGQTNEDITITLHPIGGGNGTLKFKLNIDPPDSQATFDLDTFTLSLIDPLTGVTRSPKSYKNDINNMNDGTSTIQVPAGYYLLSMTLVKTLVINEPNAISSFSAFACKSEVVHIYQNLVTEKDFNFTDSDFIANIVTNTLDYYPYSPDDPIPGSLRYAVMNLSRDKENTVRVMLPPDSEIKLKSSLFIMTEVDLVIESNGIILSKSDEPWDDRANYKRLITLMIGQNNKAKVTIRRVRFKDSDSGAIENWANLSLESCIFSGNKAVDAANLPEGGAILNTRGNLSVKGCTFYGNRAEDGNGGAICNEQGGQIDELIGNLFFGNTADNWRVIFNNNQTAGIRSCGYNAVDVPPGTGNDESGWPAGTGDTTFEFLGISGDPIDTTTFKPIPALKSFIPSLPEGFPTTDFYGKGRTAPCAPGAVNGD